MLLIIRLKCCNSSTQFWMITTLHNVYVFTIAVGSLRGRIQWSVYTQLHLLATSYHFTATFIYLTQRLLTLVNNWPVWRIRVNKIQLKKETMFFYRSALRNTIRACTRAGEFRIQFYFINFTNRDTSKQYGVKRYTQIFPFTYVHVSDMHMHR